MIDVNIKLLSETGKVPTKAHTSDAGFDIYADCAGRECYVYDSAIVEHFNDAVAITPHQTVLVHTGFAMAIPNEYFGGIFARSGLATKQGLRPANCVGVVDSGYRNEVMVALHNDTDSTKVIRHGDRIAQMIILPVYDVQLKSVDNLDETDRTGGFGSTGK